MGNFVQLVNCMSQAFSAVQLFLVNYCRLMIVHLQSLMVAFQQADLHDEASLYVNESRSLSIKSC